MATLATLSTLAPAHTPFGVEHGYAEEAAILAKIQIFKLRMAAHCANPEEKTTTEFLRNVVHYLAESPIQVPSARCVPIATASDTFKSPFRSKIRDLVAHWGPTPTSSAHPEEAGLLAEMKTLKARAASHCAHAESLKIITQTTQFLRQVVQHLPENASQVPSAMYVIHNNMLHVPQS